MKSCRGFDDSHVTDVVMLKNERVPCASEVLDSLWIPSSSPSFHGTTSMVNFEQARGDQNNHPLGKSDCKVESFDDEFDDHQPPEKKRRLTAEQVKFLEKSFDVENKLEPDRKIQLAKDLGLQPRQVAIWFQNRRARYKSKLLEKEYDSLKSCFDKLKADYDTLYSDNEKLKNEVGLLRQKVVMRENDPISGAQDGSTTAVDASSSARSDVLDSDSPRCGGGGGGGGGNQSDDISQEEDDSLVQRLWNPKNDLQYYDELQPNSCNLGFPVQNQGTWFWQY